MLVYPLALSLQLRLATAERSREAANPPMLVLIAGSLAATLRGAWHTCIMGVAPWPRGKDRSRGWDKILSPRVNPVEMGEMRTAFSVEFRLQVRLVYLLLSVAESA